MNISFPGACLMAVALCVAACTVGPDYQTPEAPIPDGFKEGADWKRANADPQAALSETWWRGYRDAELDSLVERSLAANQSIVAAEAAYRQALAVVKENEAGLFPTVSAGMSGSRSGGNTLQTVPKMGAATGTVSWEPDLWGKIHRQIEASRDQAQASDAELAGERLSIAASVAYDYFLLREADVDTSLLRRIRDIDTQVLAMIEAGYKQGAASKDDVLAARDTLEAATALLHSTESAREQYEHAIAVLTGVPPAKFSIAPNPDYAFNIPPVPLTLPSQLLERRYDVVNAERLAAAANEQIGIAVAAFYPSLDLSAQGGLESTVLSQVFAMPSRYWTLGPSLTGTIFDGGARSAAVEAARAAYDQTAATYRQTVLSAFQSVEDNLSAINHLRSQERAYDGVYQGNRALFDSQNAQFGVGRASRQSVLSQQVLLLQAEQNLRETRAVLAQGSVQLIKTLGGGWQADRPRQVSSDDPAPNGAPHP